MIRAHPVKYDAVIVGGGAAGAVIAARLSEEAERRVALIEAGPDFPDFTSTPDKIRFFSKRAKTAPSLPVIAGGRTVWPERPMGGAAEGEHAEYEWNFKAWAIGRHREIAVPQGKVIGGTSSINSALFVRGTREDFDSWAASGNAEWSYEKVLPYYRKLETDLDFADEFHGSGGPMRVGRLLRPSWDLSDHSFEEACLALGYTSSVDHNRPDSTGVGPIPRSSLDGTRMSTNRAYLSSARGRQNLSIFPETFITRVVFRGTRAVGVETLEGQIFEGTEIVICAGAVKSPHLLLLSGVGPASQLEDLRIPVVMDLPGVGQGLRDHPGLTMLWWRDPDDRKGGGATAGLAGVGGGALYLRFTAPGSELANDCRILSPKTAALDGRPETAGFDSMHMGLYLAKGKGEVRLRSRDPEVQPLIDLRFLDEDSDRRRMRDIVSIAMELANHASMRVVLGRLIDPDSDDIGSADALDFWMKEKVQTGYHLSSTAKLGPESDPDAVVNQFGKVYGLEGLRVADASIMPDCVRHNTYATTIMIGERIADFIKNS
jgi:choline dehydrogenase